MSRSFDVPCRVRISHTFDELSAHVDLGDVDVQPGDQVRVHGEALFADFGEVLEVERTATVTRASLFQSLWTRLTGDLECLELLEVSFSDRRSL